MKPDAILETVLYADEPAAAAEWYERVLGLELVRRSAGESACLRLGPGCVLLIFNPAVTGVAGRVVPSHGARGPGHIAFTIEPDALSEWRQRLGERGVEIEQEHAWTGDTWARDARSIYLRDPAGNSVELITGDIWKA